ncbi:MAG: twin-arginine translocation signal domain-containing protein [Brevundimonas sp.]|nr:twin-arginine translocation signal domain-containing protein [Brevundimonas sp.]
MQFSRRMSAGRLQPSPSRREAMKTVGVAVVVAAPGTPSAPPRQSIPAPDASAPSIRMRRRTWVTGVRTARQVRR